MALALPVVCPAGEEIAETPRGPACRCRIEDSTLDEQADARTVRGHCTAFGTGEAPGYVACTTWRAEKRRIRHGPARRLVDDPGDHPEPVDELISSREIR